AAEVQHRAAGRRLVRGLDRVGGRVGGDPAPLDAGGGGDDLERRAGEEVLAVRPGEERLLRVGVQQRRRVLGGGEVVGGERVRVVGRVRPQGEDLAGAG